MNFFSEAFRKSGRSIAYTVSMPIKRPLGRPRKVRTQPGDDLDVSSAGSFSAHIGTLLVQQRRIVGITQADLARRAEISLKYLGEIERGEANVTLAVIGRIAMALEWNPWTLFARHPPPISEKLYETLSQRLRKVQRQVRELTAILDSVEPARRHALIWVGKRDTRETPTVSGDGPHLRETKEPQ